MANDPALEALARMLKQKQPYDYNARTGAPTTRPQMLRSMQGDVADLKNGIRGLGVNSQLGLPDAPPPVSTADFGRTPPFIPPQAAANIGANVGTGIGGAIAPPTPPVTVQATPPMAPMAQPTPPPGDQGLPSTLTQSATAADANNPISMGGPDTPGFWQRFNKAISSGQVPEGYRGVMGELIKNG